MNEQDVDAPQPSTTSVSLTDEQHRLLDAALARVAEAQAALDLAHARVQEMIAFGKPEGAQSFDLEAREYHVPA